MENFGHFGVAIGGAHIDAWGAGPFMFRIDGKRWFFEDSDMFGPSVVNKSTWNPSAKQPGSRSRFWDAYGMWRKAGRPLRGTGRVKVAVWSEPKPGTYWKDQRGIAHVLTDPDLDDGSYVQVPAPTPQKPKATPCPPDTAPPACPRSGPTPQEETPK